jgi:hypothetical protein
MELATSTLRTSNVVGTPFLPNTDASAKPKFPPPNTATRTGYGGGVRIDANKHDFVAAAAADVVQQLLVVKALLCMHKQTHNRMNSDADEDARHWRMNFIIVATWLENIIVVSNNIIWILVQCDIRETLVQLYEERSSNAL